MFACEPTRTVTKSFSLTLAIIQTVERSATVKSSCAALVYSRLGFFLDRHADKLFFDPKVRDRFLRKLPRGVAYLADKRPGQRWVPTWKLMVPETLSSSQTSSVPT